MSGSPGRTAAGVSSDAAGGAASGGIELVFAGNLLVDDLVFPDGRSRMGQPGGAMIYASLGASLWGARVGVVSVAGSDYPVDILRALEARGVDLSGVRRLDRQGLRTWLLYEEHGRRVLHQLGSPSHAEVSPMPEQIPAKYLSARAIHLSPMPLESQRALVSDCVRRPGAFISLDPHEPVREENLGGWLETLRDVDAFFPGEDELKLDGAADDPRGTLRRLGVGRLKLVAFKQGTRGGVLWERECDRFVEWPPCEPPTVDHTGAGDAFAGGFLAGFVAGHGIEQALEWGATSASFAIENWGARGLLAASRETAERRRQRLFRAEGSS